MIRVATQDRPRGRHSGPMHWGNTEGRQTGFTPLRQVPLTQSQEHIQRGIALAGCGIGFSEAGAAKAAPASVFSYNTMGSLNFYAKMRRPMAQVEALAFRRHRSVGAHQGLFRIQRRKRHCRNAAAGGLRLPSRARFRPNRARMASGIEGYVALNAGGKDNAAPRLAEDRLAAQRL